MTRRTVQAFCAMVCTLAAIVSLGADVLSDAQVRELIIQESLRSYPGNCPCPYNLDRAGRSCGARSAWSRAGGYSPICYAKEISDEQVREFRSKRGLKTRMLR